MSSEFVRKDLEKSPILKIKTTATEEWIFFEGRKISLRFNEGTTQPDKGL